MCVLTHYGAQCSICTLIFKRALISGCLLVRICFWQVERIFPSQAEIYQTRSNEHFLSFHWLSLIQKNRPHNERNSVPRAEICKTIRIPWGNDRESVTSSQHDEPTQKTSETNVFGNSAARPNESTHLFPTWWANPQKTSETSVFGNSAASTYWKHSSFNERGPPLPNMMSQPTKKPLKPVCLAIAWLRPNESTVLAMKESHLFPTWWANPQKTSETSVFGISAAST